MSERDDLFRKFGPKLLEATFDFILDNVNVLRQNQGMPVLTKDEYMILLSNHVTEIPDYEWMNN